MILIAVGFMILLAACGGGVQADVFPEEVEEATPSPSPSPTPTPEPEPPSPPPGYAISLLTGLYICEEAAQRRPFAVVYNNETRAMPQAGLMQADIIYEVLAEGSITRLVAIFQDFDAEIIGPVRSSRNYMAEIANDFGAVFVHHGGSPAGYAAITNLGMDNVDGMRYDGTVFWRDANRRQTRGLEHSSVTSAENLLEIAKTRDFDMTARDNLGIFSFFDEITKLEGAEPAPTVTIPSHSAIFRFDEDGESYYKYIWGNPHMDDQVDEQISVTNVLVQVTNIHIIPGDEAGRRHVAIVGSGHGYLATMGSHTRVYWEKPDHQTPTRWTDAHGNPLQLNRGRTWVSIISASPDFE